MSNSRNEQDVNVLVLWGPSGTGKSRLAFELASRKAKETHDDYYVKTAHNTWWDGYNGEKIVIIDDYAGQWPITYALNVLDRYPMQVEFKGGSTNLQATTFIITSNYHPQDWYLTGTYDERRRESVNALLRRCNLITHSDQMASEMEELSTQPQVTTNGSQDDPIIL